MAIPEWQQIQLRGQQTCAVWQTHAPTFTIRNLTLAQHQTNVAAIAPAAQAVAAADDVVDDAMAERNRVEALVADINTRMPGKLDGELEKDDPYHKDLRDIRSIDSDSGPHIHQRGQKVVALWTKLNARNAAATPAIPALQVGTTTLAQFEALVESLPGLQQALELAESPQRDRLHDLKAAMKLVDGGNKRWYAAWASEFPEGSAEHDALSQIDTEPSGNGGNGGGDNGGGGGGGGGGDTPTVPGMATITVMNVSGALEISGEAEGATSLLIWHDGPDSGPYDVLATIAPGGTYLFSNPAMGPHRFKTQGVNDVGTGPESGEVSVDV